LVAGCGGGSGGAPVASVSRALTATFSQGLGDDTQDSTVGISQQPTGEVVFNFNEGPLKDMIVICQDHSAGVCTVVGGPAGTAATGQLEARMSGQHAYAATLQLQHDRDGTLQNSFHRLYHAAPGTSTLPPVLPQGWSTFVGKFAGGAGVDGTNGIAEGDITLTVNFDSARLSGVMSGSINPETPVSATFNNVTIAPGSGQFTSDDTSTFTFNAERASGSVNGGFFGPTAQEAAGIFELGTQSGNGMSGIFVGCTDTTTPCVSHAR